jgi:ubiquinone/menaquinone biosynthesis C-methylase UbiE
MKNTSWGNFAEKYDKYLEDDKSHHARVILPNLLRMMGEVKHKKILDVACGQGYFANLLDKEGAAVTAFDISSELIEIARKDNRDVNYIVANAESFELNKEKFDMAICVLAIQNMENVKKVFENIKSVLKDNGRIFIVINHPAFRIPKASAWGYDSKQDLQYRMIDGYMTEEKIKMDMTPGKRFDKDYTISFHRPLQYYFKILNNLDLKVARLEEWVSDRESGEGKRKAAEDKARREFPLFMCLEITK